MTDRRLSDASYLLRITGRAWSKAVAVTVICIAGIAARAVSVPVVVADISHALAYRELAHRSGEIAYGHRRCRHGQGTAQRGARDNTDRESFHGTSPGVALHG